MKSFCRRALVVALGLGLLVSTPLRALQAQQDQPAVVVSLANVDKLLGDIGYLTRAAGAPEVGGLVTLMAGQYIEGLNTKKPAGLLVSLAGPQPSGVAFVGVADFATVLAKIEEAVGEPEDVGQGVKKLALQRNVFFKESNGWIFLSDAASNLDRVPQDPAAALGELPQRYNVAVQLNVQRIPEPLRQMAISEMRRGFERGLGNQLDEEQRELQENLGRRGIENLVQFVEGADQLTIGWGVENQAGATFIDFSVTAVPGTPLAEQFAAIDNTTTRFAGFDIPQAAVRLQFASPISKEDIEQSTTMLKVMREKAFKEIDNDDDLPNDQTRSAAKEVVGSLIDVLEKTVRSGKIDGGAALLLSDGSLQFVAGGYVADGATVESSLKKLVEISKQVEHDVELQEVSFNVERYRNVDLHTLVVPVPAEEDEARQILGEQFTIVIGTGGQSVYMSLGKDAMGLIKRVIDSSDQAGEVEISPLTLNVALQPILAFAAAIENDPGIKRLAEALQQVQGRDHISVTAKAIPRGAAYRVQVEEGVLQMIGQAAKMRNAPQPNP